MDGRRPAGVTKGGHDLIREIARGRGRLERQIAESQTKIDRLVDAIANGADYGEVREALAAAKAKQAAAREALQDMQDLPVIAIHPRLADEYRRQVDDLRQALDDLSPEGRPAALNVLRGLIDRVVLTPAAAARGLDIAVEGRLQAILALATGQAPPESRLTLQGERVKGTLVVSLGSFCSTIELHPRTAEIARFSWSASPSAIDDAFVAPSSLAWLRISPWALVARADASAWPALCAGVRGGCWPETV